MSNLQVEYSTLESAATKSDGMATSFGTELQALQTQVTSMVWQGQSGTAFQGYFDTLKQQISPVQETLNQLAQQIRGAANQLQQSDATVAQGFKS